MRKPSISEEAQADIKCTLDTFFVNNPICEKGKERVPRPLLLSASTCMQTGVSHSKACLKHNEETTNQLTLSAGYILRYAIECNGFHSTSMQLSTLLCMIDDGCNKRPDENLLMPIRYLAKLQCKSLTNYKSTEYSHEKLISTITELYIRVGGWDKVNTTSEF